MNVCVQLEKMIAHDKPYRSKKKTNKTRLGSECTIILNLKYIVSLYHYIHVDVIRKWLYLTYYNLCYNISIFNSFLETGYLLDPLLWSLTYHPSCCQTQELYPEGQKLSHRSLSTAAALKYVRISTLYMNHWLRYVSVLAQCFKHLANIHQTWDQCLCRAYLVWVHQAACFVYNIDQAYQEFAHFQFWTPRDSTLSANFRHDSEQLERARLTTGLVAGYRVCGSTL